MTLIASSAEAPPESNSPQNSAPGAGAVTVEPSRGAATQSTSTPRAVTSRPARKPKCRFYATKKGCRAGDACPFIHDRAAVETAATPDSASGAQGSAEARDQNEPRASSAAERAPANVQVPAPRPVQRPTSKKELDDPRGFQISQVKTRYAAQVNTEADGTDIVTFSLAPSDPDFPFDIEALECRIRVPAAFPTSKPPTLRVSNSGLDRGYQVNVEQGFAAIWSQSAQPTLLNTLKALDKRLEAILTTQKAELFKIIAPAATASPTAATAPTASSSRTEPAATEASAVRPVPASEEPAQPSAARVREARAKRDSETQTLEHRLGRDPEFSRSHGESSTTYTVPIEPRKRGELPAPIAQVKSLRLTVPELYDLDPCTIKLVGVDGEAARNVEAAFRRRVLENPGAALLAHVNYVAQNMHIMAAQAVPQPTPEHTTAPEASQPADQPKETAAPVSTREDDRSHLHFIPRPPEWSQPQEEQDDSTDESEFSASNSDSGADLSDDDDNDDDVQQDENRETDNQIPRPNTSSAPREKGVLISLPHLELHNIELMELVVLNLTIRCTRCKDAQDVAGLRNNDKGDYTGVHSLRCKKCAAPLGVGYRRDLLHASSARAGYLDLDGCGVVDLLPSTFAPTCAACSTTLPAPPGVVSVRGDASVAVCRECHAKMVFRFAEVKFLHVGDAAVRATQGLPLKRQKQKENLGIVAGTPLPGRGRCEHYRRSCRWFRFSCCNKVFSCDKCHDAQADHPNEFANRMICGFCSREQNYRPEDCGVCHAKLTGRATSGFWEGGKGTRDRAKMSRKDPRKYKRATAPAKNKK